MSDRTTDQPWLKCSACKRDIGFQTVHWVCSVSTCNRQRTRLVFCSVVCWDSHVATLRHRDAWAVEARSPSPAAWAAELARESAVTVPPPLNAAAAPAPATAPAGAVVRRQIAVGAPAPAPAVAAPALAETERDILIVVSKLKKYIKDRAGMNCSDAVAEGLSDHVRAICDEAIRTAARDERKTVLDRDVPRVPR